MCRGCGGGSPLNCSVVKPDLILYLPPSVQRGLSAFLLVRRAAPLISCAVIGSAGVGGCGAGGTRRRCLLFLNEKNPAKWQKSGIKPHSDREHCRTMSRRRITRVSVQ